MYNVEISRLDHQGRGIGKITDKIIFVKNALPTETVTTNIIKEKKNYFEGELIEIVKESSERIKPVCSQFNKCGGCDLMHTNYQSQLEFKQQKIEDIIHRYTDYNIKIDSIVPSKDPLYYRNKVTFQISNGSLGYYEEKSKRIVPIEECFIVDKEINKIANIIKNNLNMIDFDQIIIKVTKYTQQSMLIFKSKHECNKTVISLFKDLVDSIYINDNLIYGKPNIIEKLLNYKFYISPKSFFQVNTRQAEQLYSKVLEVANISKNDIVLDLYCGTGTIGIVASSCAKEVIGIELNESAVGDANKNKELNKISNISFYSGDSGKVLKKLSINPTVVIVDPPRSGLDSLAIEQILKLNAKKIIYVSCDPMTLIRDIKLLSTNYDIIKLIPVDMFPQTNHVECVCVLNR